MTQTPQESITSWFVRICIHWFVVILGVSLSYYAFVFTYTSQKGDTSHSRGIKNGSPPTCGHKAGPPKVNHNKLCTCVRVWMFEELRDLVPNKKHSVFDIVCQYLSFFITLVIYCKNNGQCHSRQLLRCVICVLRRKVLSLTDTQTHREASSLDMHIFHHLAKMTTNKPLFTDMKQHECFS